MSLKKLLKKPPSPSSSPKSPNPNPNPISLLRRLPHHPSFSRHQLLHHHLPFLLHLVENKNNNHHSLFETLTLTLSQTLTLDPLLPLLRRLRSSPCPCSASSIFSCPRLLPIHLPPIRALLRSLRFPEATESFLLLKSSLDSHPPTSLYNLFISAFAKNRNHHNAIHWYNTMLKDRVNPDVATFNILIHSSFNNCSFDSGLKWFGEMKRRGIQPNVVSFNTIITGFFKEKRFMEGIGVAREMIDIGCGLSVASVEILMYGLCKEGKGLEMSGILMEFLKRGVVPRGVEFLVLVEALCTAGEVGRALEVVEAAWESNVEVSSVSCGALVEGLRSCGRMDEAVRLMERAVVEKGMVMDRITCNCLFEDLCWRGRTMEANRLRVLAAEKGFKPDSTTYGVLVRGFAREGRVREGEKVVDEMLDANLISNIATYNQLMDGLNHRRRKGSRAV